MNENVRVKLSEFIRREALDGELIQFCQQIRDRKTHDRNELSDFAKYLGINPLDGITDLVQRPTAPLPAPSPPPQVAAEPVASTSMTPPGKPLARIGETARGEIFAALRSGPKTIDQLGRKYQDHLYTFWKRGEVLFTGSTYTLKEKK